MIYLWLVLILILIAYAFVAGQCFEFYSREYPPIPTIKNLLLSLAWPGNAVLFLLLRCVK